MNVGEGFKYVIWVFSIQSALPSESALSGHP
jgi:hypothetical protein